MINLEKIEILSTLTEWERNTLSIFCQERNLSDSEYLFKEKDEANAMYFLIDWYLEVFRWNMWEKKVLWNVKPGEFVWEMAIFDPNHNTRTASVISAGNSRLLVLPSFSIDELTQKNPEILDKIEKIIRERKEKNNQIVN